MRIESMQMIAGFPAVQIRRLMRETVGRSISLRWISEVLQCSEPTAAGCWWTCGAKDWSFRSQATSSRR